MHQQHMPCNFHANSATLCFSCRLLSNIFNLPTFNEDMEEVGAISSITNNSRFVICMLASPQCGSNVPSTPLVPSVALYELIIMQPSTSRLSSHTAFHKMWSMVIGVITWTCIGHGNVSLLFGVGCLLGSFHCCQLDLHLNTRSLHIHHFVITLHLYLVHVGFIYECNVHSIWLVSAYISCTTSNKHCK